MTALFSFLAAWNEFLLALTFNTSNDMYTLPVGLASMISSTGQAWVICCRQPAGQSARCVAVPVFPEVPHRDFPLEASRGESMVSVKFGNVSKRYEDGFEAVKGLNLEVNDGEFLVLLALRVVENPRRSACLRDWKRSEGEISIDDAPSTISRRRPRFGHGVPILRPLSTHDGSGQPDLWSSHGQRKRPAF